MIEREQKRQRGKGELNLREDSDHPAIAEWLIQIRSQSENDQFSSLSHLFIYSSDALIEKILYHITVMELMHLVSGNHFKVMQSLAECINWNTNDLIVVVQKLFIISRKILENHAVFSNEQLESYWQWLHHSVKSSVLKSLDVEVVSSLIVRASEPLYRELLVSVEESYWFGLMMHDNYHLCLLLVKHPDIALTLSKLRGLLKNRFLESHQAIRLATLKHAVKENCYPFFQRYAEASQDYFQILMMLNHCDLLIAACNSANPSFLELMMPVLPDNLRRNTLALLATWLSVELNTAEIEHDHLRGSILTDLHKIIQRTRDHVIHYQQVDSESVFLIAKSKILKARNSQLSDEVKRALLAYLALKSLHKIIVEVACDAVSARLKAAKHHCVDATEFTIAQVLDVYLGFEQHPIPSSQPQYQRYKVFKDTAFEKFSAMRSKKLMEEIKRLQTDLIPYRACEIAKVTRLDIPHLHLDEQHADTEDRMVVVIEKLNPNILVAWVSSLDLDFWLSSTSTRYTLPGNNAHLALGAALLAQSGDYVRQPMLVASMGFYTQFVGNLREIVPVPIRMEEKTVVTINPNVNLLTERADGLICEHPLRRLFDYLMDKKTMSKILQRAFNVDRQQNVTLVRAVILDCHMNDMPCEACLAYARENQKEHTMVSKIGSILSSRKIRADGVFLPLLIRISLQALNNGIHSQPLCASPLSKLTPPNSQLSPSAVMPTENEAKKVDIPSFLMSKRKAPLRLFDITNKAIERTPPQPFKPRCVLKNPAEKNGMRLAENCIVMNKLSINPPDVNHNFSPNIKQYTVMIGGCK